MPRYLPEFNALFERCRETPSWSSTPSKPRSLSDRNIKNIWGTNNVTDPASLVPSTDIPDPGAVPLGSSTNLNTWHYPEGALSLVQRRKQTRLLEPTGNNVFRVSSEIHDPVLRLLMEKHLTQGTHHADNGWTDQDIEKLPEYFIIQATKNYDEQGTRLVASAVAMNRYFSQLPAMMASDGARTKFAKYLDSAVGDMFLFYWEPDSPYSFNRCNVHDPSYVMIALNLTKFLGDLYNAGLVDIGLFLLALRLLRENLISVQHVEGLRHIIVRGGPRLWGLPSVRIEHQITLNFLDVLTSYVYWKHFLDYLPSVRNKRSALDWHQDIKEFLSRFLRYH